MSETISVKEAASRLGICENTVREGIRRGEIPSLKVCGRYIIPRERFEAFMSGRPVNGASDSYRDALIAVIEANVEGLNKLLEVLKNPPESIKSVAEAEEYPGKRAYRERQAAKRAAQA
jgi:excisionase family DNA binding protein